jgi:hypothetical protein
MERSKSTYTAFSEKLAQKVATASLHKWPREMRRARATFAKIEYLRSLWLAAQARPPNPAAPAVRREAEEDWGR